MKTTPDNPVCERCEKLKSEHLGWTRLVCWSGHPAAPMFHRRAEDMPRLAVAPHPSVPLGSYVHVKSGGRYEVIGGVFDASGEGDVVQVLYQSVEHGYLAQRPAKEFAAKFTRLVSAGVAS